MKQRMFFAGLFLVGAVCTAPLFSYTRDVVLATDHNPDPHIFETTLVIDEALVDLDDDGVDEKVFAVNGMVPGPTIQVNLGDEVIIHVENQLDRLPTMIHWHGVELNNESDGSPVTQNEMEKGEVHTYHFIAVRPGLFWYHPHVMPSDQTFRGVYGAVIILDPHEATLQGLGVLPTDRKTIVLSDITVCTGNEVNGPCSMSRCGAMGTEECSSGDVPFVQPDFDCKMGGIAGSCFVALGTKFLVNGTELKDGDFLEVKSGQGLWLRLLNMAIFRYFRLVPPPGHTLYRVGGEGGLLDTVRMEGGTEGAFITGYTPGEIVLSPGDRADVVLIPTGSEGDELEITMSSYSKTLVIPGAQPILRFKIAGTAAPVFIIAEGDPLRTHPMVNDPINVLPATTDHLIDPATELSEPRLGSASEIIKLQADVVSKCASSAECRAGVECRDDSDMLCPPSADISCGCQADGPGPAVDGYRSTLDLGGADYTLLPHLGSSRFARVGDLLQLSVENETFAHHPFHLHGFSFQPLRVYDAGTNTTLFAFDYNEFIDNWDLHAGQGLEFRVLLEERPSVAEILVGGEGGGAVGRWLFHCHILHHAALGMLSELVVVDEIFGDGFESGDTTRWSQTVP